MKTFYGLEIPKRNNKCIQGESFLDGEDVYSNLIFSENNFIRQDFCHKCWNEQLKQNEEHISLTQWKSIFFKKEEKELFLNREEKILSLLKEKASNEHIEEQQQAYILALYLLRKKIIFCRKEFKNENNDFFYLLEVAETEEIIIIKKFLNHILDIPSLQKKISIILKDK